MKFLRVSLNTHSLLVIFIFLFAACNKESEDAREQFKGDYFLTGTSQYIFDAFNRYWEKQGTDTASFRISYTKSADSSNYIILTGGTISSEVSQYHIKFQDNGVPVYATLNNTNFIIPFQRPWEGSGLTIEGNGSFRNNDITLTYKTFYRGLTKISTLTGRRK